MSLMENKMVALSVIADRTAEYTINLCRVASCPLSKQEDEIH